MDVVDQAGIMLVHHSQLVTGCAHIQAAHGRVLLQQCDREWVIHKNLQNLPSQRKHVKSSAKRKTTDCVSDIYRIKKKETNVDQHEHLGIPQHVHTVPNITAK